MKSGYNVSVSNGIYSVLLGSRNSLSEAIFDGNVKYLGIKVGNDSEMSPRHKIVSVGYAIRSNIASLVNVKDDNNDKTLALLTTKESSGSLQINDVDGNLKTEIYAGDLKKDEKAGRAYLYGQTGNRNIALSYGIDNPQLGGISTYYNGQPTVSIGPCIWVLNSENGKPLAALIWAFALDDPDKRCYGNLSIFGTNDNEVVWADGFHDVGRIITRGKNGSSNVSITHPGSYLNKGAIYLYDDDDVEKATLQVLSTKGGGLFTHTGHNSDAVWITTTIGSGSRSDEAGYIAVYDKYGNEVITLNGSNGSITGTTKNFRIKHPTDPTKEIYYSSLEGPEVSVYIRGTGRLISGEAVVRFPDYFKLITSDQGITVQVTPRGDCKGLYVEEATPERIVVKELQGGKSNVEFDYFVQGVRKGYENKPVIREKKGK